MTHPSSGWLSHPLSHFLDTLPETNIAPENRPLEKEILIGNHHFQGRTVSFREGSCLTPHWVTLMGNASFQPAARFFLPQYVEANKSNEHMAPFWNQKGMDYIGETKNPRDHSQGNQKGFTDLVFPWEQKQQQQKATAQVATQFVRDLGRNILVSSGPTRERERERELGI